MGLKNSSADPAEDFLWQKKRAAEAAEGFLGAKNGSAEAAAHFLWRKSVRQRLPRPKKESKALFGAMDSLIYFWRTIS